ncbi:MAG: tryptophan--tRNA ligase [Desulfurococcaceae archaeon]
MAGVARIDPWGFDAVSEYGELMEQFGISPINELVKSAGLRHFLFTRGIIFGHRDFDSWLGALRRGEKVAVLTGVMPTGKPHLATLVLFEELRLLQEMGAHVKFAVADAEAYSVRREERKEAIENGLELVAHAIAWGIDPSRAEFYFQTAMDDNYYRLIQMFSRKVTMAELEAIYGDLSPSKIVSVLTQAADILHLQLPSYGGYRYVLVPVGIDQDPHLRLARDLAERFRGELGLERPASIYHKLMRGLDGGGKMSKSRPDSAIFVDDDEEVAARKVMNAFTGGRATAEEQRKLGGEPHKCPVYDLYAFLLVRDDKALASIYEECTTGKILCGECKRRAAELLVKMLREHKERYRKVIDSGMHLKAIRTPSF